MVLSASAGVRIYLIATSEIVSRDGVTFVEYAQGLRAAPVAEMRKQAQHPLYPLTILIVHSTTGTWLADEPVHGWPLAGQIASMLAGLLVIAAAYALGKTMWDARVGVIAALFAGMLPELCQVTSDALSDGLHLGLYMWGLVVLIHARHTGRLRWVAVAAILSGLAFLTRPEGGSILVIGVVAIALPSRNGHWPWRRRVAGIALMSLCFAVLAGPYMVAVGRVIKKKNVLELFGLEEQAASAAAPAPRTRPLVVDPPGRAGMELPIPLEVPYQWARCLRVVYFLLAIPALTLRLVPRPRGLLLLVLAWLLHMGLLYALASSFGYVSLRHLLVPGALTLPFSAATFRWLVDQASLRVASKHGRRARVVRPLAYLIGAAMVILPTTRWMLRPIGEHNAYIVRAGRWLNANGKPGSTILTTRRRVAYYAEMPMWLGPDTGSIDDLADYIRQMRRGYLVIEVSHVTASHRNQEFFADLQASPLNHRLKRVHEEPEGRGTIVIYEILPPTSSQST